MSGKLKADYTTGEGSVILPPEFMALPKEVKRKLLQAWLDQINAMSLDIGGHFELQEIEEVTEKQEVAKIVKKVAAKKTAK